MNRRLMALLLPLLACLLTGCIELTQEIWVNPDGSGRIRTDLGVDPSLLAMGEEGSGPGESIEQQAAALRRIDGITAVETGRYTEGAEQHFTLEVGLADIRLAAATLAAGMEGEDRQSATPPPTVDFTPLPSGNLGFSYGFELPPELGAGMDAGADTEMAAAMRAMMAQAFAGRMFTVIIHAPGIVSGSGERSADGTAMTWSVPLLDLVGARPAAQRFTAELALAPGRAAAANVAAAVAGPDAVGFPKLVRVIAREAVIRTGPGPDYPVVDIAAEGSTWRASARENEWYRIEIPGRGAGWLGSGWVRTETPAPASAGAPGIDPARRARLDYLRQLARDLQRNFTPEELAAFRAALDAAR